VEAFLIRAGVARELIPELFSALRANKHYVRPEPEQSLCTRTHSKRASLETATT